MPTPSDPTELEQALQAMRSLPEPPGAGNGDSLAQQLQQQLWADDRDPLALAALGAALTRLGRYSAAIEALDRAHWLQPESPHLLYHYALALQGAGRGREARLRLEAALRLDPGYRDARRLLQELGGTPPVSEGRPAAVRDLSWLDTPRSEAPAPRSGPSRDAAPLARRAAVEEEEPEESEEEGFPEWEPEPPPGFLALAQAALRVWGQQPLLWLILLAIPNALAAVVISFGWATSSTVVLVWAAALGLGTAPTVLAMASQRIREITDRYGWAPTPGRLLGGTLLTLPYVLLTAGSVGFALAEGTPFPPEVLVLAGLLFTVPFHALLAPALVSAVTDGPGGFGALGAAVRYAGRRTWLHLGVMLSVMVVLGAALAWVALLFTSVVQGAGEAVMVIGQVTALSLGGSVWTVLVAVCGLDALPAALPEPDPDYELHPSEEGAYAG